MKYLIHAETSDGVQNSTGELSILLVIKKKIVLRDGKEFELPYLDLDLQHEWFNLKWDPKHKDMLESLRSKEFMTKILTFD